ncbi:TAXI family TRAP transporter solute-binding subunit [Haladaptatus caseinilyticus]|uniref:TAXI family TRAP transporter solute-binding subunit n=1 Tax=Haladaptatus caseinilyticus TaxID=2993314 RepID=UPI00389927FC
MVGELNRRGFVKAVGATGLLGLSGTTSAQQQRLTWFAGGTGGTYFPLSNQFKTIIENNTDYTVQVQSTGASVENVGGLAQGNADFALIQNDVAFYAYNGTGISEFQGTAIKSLRGVATLYPETIHIVTLQESNIDTLEDLQGKTINTGDLGSGTQLNAIQILESVGIQQNDFTQQNTSFSQAADQLRNGDIDAAFVVGGWPVGAIEELATTNNIAFVQISGQTRQNIRNQATWFADDTIPAGTYSGQNEPVQTVAVQAMIATTQDQPNPAVSGVTESIFNNTGQLTLKQQFINRKTALDGMSIPLHPAAREIFGPATTQGGGNQGGGSGSGGNDSGGNGGS